MKVIKFEELNKRKVNVEEDFEVVNKDRKIIVWKNIGKMLVIAMAMFTEEEQKLWLMFLQNLPKAIQKKELLLIKSVDNCLSTDIYEVIDEATKQFFGE